MQYCTACHGDSPADARFCIHCGRALGSVASGPTIRLKLPDPAPSIDVTRQLPRPQVRPPGVPGRPLRAHTPPALSRKVSKAPRAGEHARQTALAPARLWHLWAPLVGLLIWMTRAHDLALLQLTPLVALLAIGVATYALIVGNSSRLFQIAIAMLFLLVMITTNQAFPWIVPLVLWLILARFRAGMIMRLLGAIWFAGVSIPVLMLFIQLR